MGWLKPYVACITVLMSACGLDVVGSGASVVDVLGDASVASTDAAVSPDASRDATSSVNDAAMDAAVADDAIADDGGPPATLALDPPTFPATSDLTGEGTTDWVHWGLAPQLVRKAMGSGVIPDYVASGTGYTPHDLDFDGWPMATSWTDGPPAAVSAKNSKTHRYFVGSTDVVLAFDLPATRAPQIATLYLGGYRARGRLELSFNDAPNIITSDERENKDYYFASRYVVRYSGNSSATKLLIRWKMVKVYDPAGTIILSSIALGPG